MVLRPSSDASRFRSLGVASSGAAERRSKPGFSSGEAVDKATLRRLATFSNTGNCEPVMSIDVLVSTKLDRVDEELSHVVARQHTRCTYIKPVLCNVSHSPGVHAVVSLDGWHRR